MEFHEFFLLQLLLDLAFALALWSVPSWIPRIFFFFFLMFVSFVCVWICSYVEVCSVAMSANWRVFCVRGQHFLYDWGLLDVVLRVCRCETRLPWGTRAATWQFFFWINFFGWSKFWITWLFIYFLCLVKQVSITNILSTIGGFTN